MSLNYLCSHDISDDDCLRCAIHGLKFTCPEGCPDFDDIRIGMPEELKRERERLMKILGVEDKIPEGGRP